MSSAEFRATSPKDIPYTLTATMSLSDWVKVRNTLQTDEGIVAWALWNAIGKMVDEAQHVHRQYWNSNAD